MPKSTEKMIYDPINADEFLILRIYAHPDNVTEEIVSELEALMAKGCVVVHQVGHKDDVEVKQPRGLLTHAQERLEHKRRNERVGKLQQDLLKELNGVTEESIAALVAAIRKSK